MKKIDLIYQCTYIFQVGVFPLSRSEKFMTLASGPLKIEPKRGEKWSLSKVEACTKTSSVQKQKIKVKASEYNIKHFTMTIEALLH